MLTFCELILLFGSPLARETRPGPVSPGYRGLRIWAHQSRLEHAKVKT